jgi:circadian clock protein KaiC
LENNSLQRASFGIEGLDEVLYGGLLVEQAYLIKGMPGTGKTILGLHFLCAGVAAQEPVLFITLAESEESLRRNAVLMGFDLNGINILDLSPTSEYFAQKRSYDIFSPADVERGPITQKILEKLQQLSPKRVFVDSMTQFRYLATDQVQFHKQVLSFIRYLTDNGCTVLLTAEGSLENPDTDLEFLSDGIIDLTYNHHDDTRLLQIVKFRGSSFKGGGHVLRINHSGIQVYPRLRPEGFRRDYVIEQISSGIPDLDELLNGGIERGTITIVSGPTGAGKSTFGLQFMKEAAGRGERSVVYTFEEMKETILHRCENVNIPVRSMLKQETLSIVEVEALSISSDEFAQQVRHEVEQRQARIVMIDSISGYKLSIQGVDLIKRLHALCKYLQNMGVTVILINEIDTITGDFQATGIGISYLSDNLIFLRYLEVDGHLRKSVGVIKKRLSGFEPTLREFEITRYGLKVGKPLTNLRGILSGTPNWVE